MLVPLREVGWSHFIPNGSVCALEGRHYDALDDLLQPGDVDVERERSPQMLPHVRRVDTGDRDPGIDAHDAGHEPALGANVDSVVPG